MIYYIILCREFHPKWMSGSMCSLVVWTDAEGFLHARGISIPPFDIDLNSNLFIGLYIIYGAIPSPVDPLVLNPFYGWGRISWLLGSFAKWPLNSSGNSACLSPALLIQHQRHRWEPQHSWKCCLSDWQSSSPWMLPDLHNPTSWGLDYPGNGHESVPHRLETRMHYVNCCKTTFIWHNLLVAPSLLVSLAM